MASVSPPLTHVFLLGIQEEDVSRFAVYGTCGAAMRVVEEDRTSRGLVWDPSPFHTIQPPYWTWSNRNTPHFNDPENVDLKAHRVSFKLDQPYSSTSYRISRVVVRKPRALADMTEGELSELTVEVDAQWARGVGVPEP